jgi:hypothetical protein
MTRRRIGPGLRTSLRSGHPVGAPEMVGDQVDGVETGIAAQAVDTARGNGPNPRRDAVTGRRVRIRVRISVNSPSREARMRDPQRTRGLELPQLAPRSGAP